MNRFFKINLSYNVRRKKERETRLYIYDRDIRKLKKKYVEKK